MGGRGQVSPTFSKSRRGTQVASSLITHRSSQPCKIMDSCVRAIPKGTTLNLPRSGTHLDSGQTPEPKCSRAWCSSAGANVLVHCGQVWGT